MEERKIKQIFVGTKFEKFENKVFSWPAFFFGGMYFAYRKMIIHAILVSLITSLMYSVAYEVLNLSLIIVAVLCINIAIGLFFPLWYRKYYTNQSIKILSKTTDEQEQIRYAQKQGGTSIAFIILVLIINTIITNVTGGLFKNSDNSSHLSSTDTSEISTQDTENTEDTDEKSNQNNKKEGDSNTITEDFDLTGSMTFNNQTTLTCSIYDKNPPVSLSIDPDKFNIPSEIYDFRNDIKIRITYKDENNIYDCKVINASTNEILDDLSEDNLNKLFNIEYGAEIIEKDWVEKISLSDLNENEIYKYIAKETSNIPEIENNTGKNCLLYKKEEKDSVFYNPKEYKKTIMVNRSISGNSLSMSFNEFEENQALYIKYKAISNEELIKEADKDSIIYLSKYNSGDSLEYTTSSDYIYNDTDRSITLDISDNAFQMDYNNSFTIEPDEICGFDWKVDSVTIK